jgi:hypothetical protein
MEVLQLRSRHARAVGFSWGEEEICLRGGEWQVEGSPEALEPVERALKRFCERFNDRLLLLNFRNAVGRFAVPGRGTLRVSSGKWDERHFEEMLEEIARVAQGLSFDSGERAALPYERGIAAHEDVRYHAFVYLRHILSDMAPVSSRLMPSLRAILEEPHRQLNRAPRRVPLERVREADARSLGAVLAQPSLWSRVTPEVETRSPLARWLRGHLPREVEEVSARQSFDTPENRFIRGFLSLASEVIHAVRCEVGGEERLAADCQWMKERLQPVLQHPLWKEVGPMGHVPLASPVLQRRRGYREVFRHFTRLRLATRLPLSAERAMDLLEVKDIALLYEIWVFFCVVEVLAELLGEPPQAARLVQAGTFGWKLQRELRVSWRSGVRVLYNASFSPGAEEDQRSYSVRLRPDIALQFPSASGVELHLMDAKFRLEQLDTADREEAPAGLLAVEEERRGLFRREDLYKMHTYRDAIPTARTVWVLYPGTELHCFPATGGSQEPEEALSRMREGGIGGVPLTPGHGGKEELRRVLRMMLKGTGDTSR